MKQEKYLITQKETNSNPKTEEQFRYLQHWNTLISFAQLGAPLLAYTIVLLICLRIYHWYIDNNAIDHALTLQNFKVSKVNNSKKGAAKDIGQITKPYKAANEKVKCLNLHMTPSNYKSSYL
jgi:hypothetical protein